MRFARAACAALLLALAAVVAVGSPAAAHEGTGIIAVEKAEDRADGTDYTIRVTWENDRHPAADATVTATAVDPTGQAQTPVTMAAVDADGRYNGFVQLGGPGYWTVRFAVIAPTATSEVSRAVVAPSTTTSTTAATTTTLLPEIDDGNGGPAKALIGGTILVLIVGGAAIGFRRSTRKHS